MEGSAAAAEAAKLDIVVFGASGFTGKYVVRELLRAGLGDRNVALAGRNRSKLAEALKWAMETSSIQAPQPLPLIEADVSNPSTLAAMCRRARLVLNCVGPFRLYGEPVVSACVDAGADYLDITGEPEFMERMEVSYHEAAKEKGVLVVSACGYDSIPAEIGLLHHLSQWTAAATWVPYSVNCLIHITSTEKVVGNVGTWESAVLGVSSAKELRKLRARTKSTRARVTVPGPSITKPSSISWNKALNMWAVILPSADSAVVRRTMSAIAAGGPPSIAEEEMGLLSMDAARKEVFRPVHFGVFSAVPNIFHVLAQVWLGISILSLGMFAFGRRLLLRFPGFFSFGLFQRGGPTENQVEAAKFKLWFIGRGYSDPAIASMPAHHPEPDMEVITSVSGPEIGYITTPICLVQCASIMLDRRRDLPRGGVYTPGVVFGTTDLQQRLEANGISFKLESKRSLR